MNTFRRIILYGAMSSAFFAAAPEARQFYVDPSVGKISNDGSAEHPWNTLKAVFDSGKIETRKYETKPAKAGADMIVKNSGAPVKPGDTVILRGGFHGEVFAAEYYNDDFITIMAQPGHRPKVGTLELRSGCKWRVQGLTVSPSFAEPYRKKRLLEFSSHNWTGASWSCIAEACTAYSVLDASGWTKEQWDTLSCDGTLLPGNGMIARNNYFKNVNFGISVTGDSCLVEGNIVENFAGDGLRGLGDYCTFQYNIVKNCYAVNANHDDGFQSWSVGDSGDVGTGVVRGVVLRGNTILNYEDPNQPFRGTLQGIGCFDGMFEDWLIVNNVIMTDHWHGITLSGATGCVIINNTVVDLNTAEPGPPWIRISDHKDGTPSTGCIVRNNLATAYNSSGAGVVSDHNITVKNYDDFFVGYAAGNVHLKSGCAAIDAGAADRAPPEDRDGLPRPQGSGVDAGAYEYGANRIIDESSARRSGEVSFSFAADGRVIRFKNSRDCELSIFNLRGECVHSLNVRGRNIIAWPGGKIGSGAYLLRVVSHGRSASETMAIVR